MSDKALEMFGDLPDFPGSRAPKNRPSSKKQNSLLSDRFNGARYKVYRINGEDMQIAFNAKFMIEMLNAADTEEVRLELSTPSKAGLIKPSEQAEGEDLLMLVMPLMLNS